MLHTERGGVPVIPTDWKLKGESNEGGTGEKGDYNEGNTQRTEGTRVKVAHRELRGH